MDRVRSEATASASSPFFSSFVDRGVAPTAPATPEPRRALALPGDVGPTGGGGGGGVSCFAGWSVTMPTLTRAWMNFLA